MKEGERIVEKPLVVSLSGISGSGKTTLAHALKSEAPNSEVISFDDISGDWLGRDYCEWSEAGADCNVWNASGFIEQIRNYLEFPLRYIIVDYPFGHAHNEVSPFIDFAVWIDIPLDISLARRILRDFTRRPPKRRDLVGNIADEISAYLDFYMDRHRDTYPKFPKIYLPYWQ